MGAHSTAHQPRRGKGKHRAQTESSIERYAFLGAGAITLGVGAALASGAGVASAETSDTNDAPSAQPAADKQADKEKGSKPADGAEKKKPESKFGSGRDGADKPDAASKVGAAVRNELKRVAKTADEVRTKVSDAVDKLADATELRKPAAPAVPDVAKPVSTKKWPDPFAVVRDVVTDDDAAVVDKTPEPTNDVLAAEDVAPTDGPVPWSPNPFRPMPPEPVPVNMPDLIYGVEQTFVDAFEGVPGFQPFVREGFELGFRATQMVPWVNAAIPVINIVGQLPNVTSGDPVVRKDATQNIINNLIVTIHPVSVAFYGYDQIADILNVEYEGQQLKVWFYTTSWNLLDPFELLHNKDQSGLPLSQSTSSTSTFASNAPVGRSASIGALAVVGDEPGTSPFRPEDPDPKGMPEGLLSIRNGVMDVLPDELSPIYREAFEAVYRGSQMVPYVNAVVPITEILPALALAANGDKAGAQVAINQLILTTGPVSLLYYGYDQIADLLNVEDAADDAKKQLYIGLWDGIDSTGALHPLGQSGLPE